ncbi:hypothetical protein PLICRDRAFT_96523 [Plicaturopsis crispa FD-325 SS-3]|nr:hypothetical protein PLICRDRAFT_96523 [Plicaturopsis crispa FD-325 SS-3]
MSFSFEWPRFSDQFHADAIQMLNTALNKGNKPPVIADKIEVVELEMGSEPPELEIRDIGDLTVDQFRGIFRLSYSGDAHIVLKTKVQANPLNHKQPDIHLMSGSRGMLAAKQPLVVPMLLRLSHFKLNSYVVLVVSKQKGITLVFKTDPLQNVDINSTFDSIAVIQKFIQREIEGQLRQMFREDLPGIIHRLSQQWVKAKVEAPYLNHPPPPPPPVRRKSSGTMSAPDLSTSRMSNVGLQPYFRQQSMAPLGLNRTRSTSGHSMASSSRRTSATTRSMPTPPPPPIPTEPSSFPDIENFDPTYGLRPDGLPTKSFFGNFGRLFTPNKGLGDLAEDPDEEEYEESASFDVVEWEDTVPDYPSPPSVSEPDMSAADTTEYETIPAVGGGMITRPRVYHSQSLIQPPSDGKRSSAAPPLVRSPLSSSYDYTMAGPRSALPSISRRPTSYFSDLAPRYERLSASVDYSSNAAQFKDRTSRPRSASAEFFHQSSTPLFRPNSTRPHTPDSEETQPSRSSSGLSPSLETPPSVSHAPDPDDGAIYVKRSSSDRRPSISSSSDPFQFSTSHSQHHFSEPDPEIVLRPSINNTIHQLSTLSQSNHTLSPYTRSLEHFTVRSVPPRGVGPSGLSMSTERQPVKAKRKRTYWLGKKSKAEAPRSPPLSSSPTPPSEFDASDMDRYFRSRDDLMNSPVLSPTHVLRHRPSFQPV